jgi:hypothetical protein
MAQPRCVGTCGCGCGEATAIATKTRADRGWVKGEPKPFVGKHRMRIGGLAHHLDDGVERMTSGCWVWTRAVAPNGYGYVRVQGSLQLAHRVFYEREHGPISDDLHLDHLCRNQRCVNPDHLEPVTCRENVRRGVVARRGETIATIQTMHATGISRRAISRELSVSRHFIASRASRQLCA